MSGQTYTGILPMMAMRGLVVFPGQSAHFDVGRSKSIKALEEAMKNSQYIFLIPQINMLTNDPKLRDLYEIGTVAKIKQILRSKEGAACRVLVHGVCRGKIDNMLQYEPFMSAEVTSVVDRIKLNSPPNDALCREAVRLYSDYLETTDYPGQDVFLRIFDSTNAALIADMIAQNSGIDFASKAKVLCCLKPERRLEIAVRALQHETQVVQIMDEIQEKTQENLDRHQKEYLLREKMKVIRSELGEDDEDAEFQEYEKKILLLNLDEESEMKLRKDLDRLRKQPFGSAEGALLRNYLDTVLSLPWNKSTKERISVEVASKVLEKDHFGLEKVKERILETVAVRQMAPEMPPQIICLVGPPGVGKTSIAYSVARALNRKLARISLGGVRDEADIRGHRKTYIGAMPGRIITALEKAGAMNPLILLDEIDKMGSDYRGDPSAALLEVLDAEQNKTYRDHYLEIPVDLSDVMFITTANTLDTVPRPLLDRMEIIELGSYTDEEKLMIAKNHLLPKQIAKHGLKKSQLKVSDDAIREIIACYTRESGVRSLERCFAELCRKADRRLLDDESLKKITIQSDNVADFLGIRKFLPDKMSAVDPVGLVTGLAWTALGGETLEVEVNVMDGSGKLELTGNLGDVMKESAHAALSYIRANAQKLGVSTDFYKTRDIHVHFPAGAIPKDGPSAGVTVTTAMVSALTNTPVRRDVAMTGEISIRGRVLPIGGLKEKTMAALRHGVSTVIIPEDNRRDLEEIDQTVRRALHFVMAATVDTVLDTALIRTTEPAPTILGELPLDLNNRPCQNAIQQ